ncbi:hypothetical protein ACTI_61410 [Actinoplanes sp. OR16]|uniref:PepSY domain-containing protein n=1 Tax=Actinoplanes sp. OR16 TaxID=946334 RepID=UPI000F6FB1B5|nr:PepSY domain-containing protein [Actinoplanes sp. OR16]BBH69456.1 hypothetical protein ACTI_61410 [Actinoplanes sp. OR16]
MLKKSAVVLAAGTIAALGITGTALAMDTPSPSTSGPSSVAPSTAGSGAPTGSGAATGSGAPTGSGTAISEARAREIALAAVPGGTVEEIEQETENKVAVWDVEVKAGTTEHEFEIDAATGEVLHQDTEQDDADDDNDDDD